MGGLRQQHAMDVSHIPGRNACHRRHTRHSPVSSARMRCSGAPGISPTTENCSGVIGVIAAGFTSFYMFRLLILTFYGSPRYTHDDVAHVHESPASMLFPLVVLSDFRDHCRLCGCSGDPGWQRPHSSSSLRRHAHEPESESSGHKHHRTGADGAYRREQRFLGLLLAYLFYVRQARSCPRS